MNEHVVPLLTEIDFNLLVNRCEPGFPFPYKHWLSDVEQGIRASKASSSSTAGPGSPACRPAGRSAHARRTDRPMQ